MNEIKYVKDGVEYSLVQGKVRPHEVMFYKGTINMGRIEFTKLFKLFGV